MVSPMVDGRIAALLEDPLVKMMMRADGVDRQSLARELGHVARHLRHGEDGGLKLAGWLSGCGTAPRSRDAGACCR